MPTYTVIGVCEEQRHAFLVDADNPEEAEKEAKKEHDKTGASYNFVVAGVVEGEVPMVDTCDWGIDQARREAHL